MIRRPPRSTLSSSSAASDVYKRQYQRRVRGSLIPMLAGPKGILAWCSLYTAGAATGFFAYDCYLSTFRGVEEELHLRRERERLLAEHNQRRRETRDRIRREAEEA
eukprot:TRINITY_DN28061_c0_g1_i3.p1 TRINITY_DN28061_c0_g1~~TRINITY_DN28061_c0_g1_i3.p1  ORF type:complete len:106 (-),score=30.76 TRINITY_DN28061_c0_g1_i3:550-867(-)